ncbi:unnamed protein product [Vicia faba]|uniref:Uncharacterized protein n=1 Tax=Vicia faba TaxID=3906 RepID=A0AAV0ZL18_VICFA|nr:unnamed protein product [Vicia faba]
MMLNELISRKGSSGAYYLPVLYSDFFLNMDSSLFCLSWDFSFLDSLNAMWVSESIWTVNTVGILFFFEIFEFDAMDEPPSVLEVEVWKLALACHTKVHLRIFLDNTRGGNVVKHYISKMEKED